MTAVVWKNPTFYLLLHHNVFPQSQTGGGLVLEAADDKPEEDLHYEEVNFVKTKHEPSSVSVHSSRQQQETVYSQVRVSEAKSSSIRTADHLYAK